MTYHEVGTPANWKEGEDVFILPSVSSANAPQMFSKVKKEIRGHDKPTLAHGRLD